MLGKFGYLMKTNFACLERRNRRFIGGIEHRTSRAAPARHLAPQPQGGKTVPVRRFKRYLTHFTEFKPPGSARQPVRVGQGILNRQLHVGIG